MHLGKVNSIRFLILNGFLISLEKGVWGDGGCRADNGGDGVTLSMRLLLSLFPDAGLFPVIFRITARPIIGDTV